MGEHQSSLPDTEKELGVCISQLSLVLLITSQWLKTTKVYFSSTAPVGSGSATSWFWASLHWENYAKGALIRNRLFSGAAVPSLFGSRDWFCGRRFFHRPGGGGWCRNDSGYYIQAHLLLCRQVPNRPRLVLVAAWRLGMPSLEGKANMGLQNFCSVSAGIGQSVTCTRPTGRGEKATREGIWRHRAQYRGQQMCWANTIEWEGAEHCSIRPCVSNKWKVVDNLYRKLEGATILHRVLKKPMHLKLNFKHLQTKTGDIL